MRALVPHMVIYLRAQVEGRVTASGASEMGWGSCESLLLRLEAERLLSAAVTPTEWQTRLTSFVSEYTLTGDESGPSQKALCRKRALLVSLHDCGAAGALAFGLPARRYGGMRFLYLFKKGDPASLARYGRLGASQVVARGGGRGA